MVRRFAMLAASLSFVLGLSVSPLFAQGDAKKDETKSEANKKEESLPPIPPEVEKKLEAARRAVAEAIVAAQDAGLVKSSIDPPPILDILITGRANDESTLKARTGVSPEVFGAWYTGYGKTKDVEPTKDVRITQPSAGLKAWYDQRASILNREIEAVRKSRADETRKADDVKKADEARKADEAKAAAMRVEETKKKEDDARAAAMKAEAAKKAEETKKKADEEAKKKE